jgi:hypothetical protein
MVAVSLRGGAAAAAATPELKAFLQKNGLPAGTEKELVESGITTLQQFRVVKQDKAQLEQLKERLDNSGIRLAAQQIDRIKVADIEDEIAAVNSPAGKDAAARKEAFTKAITEVEALRNAVKSSADTDFTSVQKTVTEEYNAVVNKIKDLAGTDFTNAASDAKLTRDGLASLLSTAITDMTAAKDILASVDATPRALTQMMRDQYMLCGFLLSPDKPIRKSFELVKLPESPEKMKRDPDAMQDYKKTYKGSETTSFAAQRRGQAASRGDCAALRRGPSRQDASRKGTGRQDSGVLRRLWVALLPAVFARRTLPVQGDRQGEVRNRQGSTHRSRREGNRGCRVSVGLLRRPRRGGQGWHERQRPTNKRRVNG